MQGIPPASPERRETGSFYLEDQLRIWFSEGFESFVLKNVFPNIFGIVINDRCNLNCIYCESNKSGRYHFSLEQAKP